MISEHVRFCVIGLGLLVGLGALPRPAAGQVDYDTARRERHLEAVKSSVPITIDGALDEAVWREAPVAGAFLQSEPDEGEPATQQTEVRVAYDDEALYLGIFAHESSRADIIVGDLKKDFDTARTDMIQFVVDTFHDERNGYMFAVNPMGAKWDAQMVNDGRDTNVNWDGLWFAKTRIVNDGWYAELAIPFRTLRFEGGDAQTWGINFMRQIRRRNEETYWAPIPRFYALTRVSMAGTLGGLRGVRPGNDLRLKPYMLTSGNTVGSRPVDGDLEAGFDAKYGVTSSLTWDFTVNTDFSQVEADEQQVNLTRFSLFFPEKRDFFLENAGVYQFGVAGQTAGGGGGGGGGRSNTLGDNILFFSRTIGLSKTGDAIPILAGTRLTGRAAGLTIGAMNIQQRDDVAAPATNVTALRARRNILANSDVGVMILNKEVNGPTYNRLAGADANFRFFQNLNVNGMVAKTVSPDSVVGTSGSDAFGRGAFSYRGDRLETRAAYTFVGTRFNDELGFIPRTNVGRTDGYFGLHFRPKRVSRWLRETFPHYQMVNITRADSGAFDSRYMDWHLPFTLQDSSFIEVGRNTNLEELTAPFPINSNRGIAIAPGRYEFDEDFILWNSNRAARLSFTGRYAVGTFYDGYKHNYSGGTAFRLNAQLNTSVNWSRNVISLSQGAYTTDLITGRANISFSTRMFLNALLQYNTDARQWSSNVRFNIIHRPLSDFYFVYNDRRDTRSGALIDRALIGKVTYLMAF
jgi:hypothetical protein